MVPGSSVRGRPRVGWVMGQLAMTPRFLLLAPVGDSCPPPACTVVDRRDTLGLPPSFSTDFALLSLLTTKSNH